MHPTIEELKQDVAIARGHLEQSAMADPALIAVKGLLDVIARRADVDGAFKTWLPDVDQKLTALGEEMVKVAEAKDQRINELEDKVARLQSELDTAIVNAVAVEIAEQKPTPIKKSG